MGAALNTLPDAVELTGKNPKLIAIVFFATIAAFVFGFIAALIPIIGNFIALPIVGIIYAGVIGTVFVAMRDRTGTTVAAYFDTIKRKWKSIAGAFFLLAVLQLVAVIALVIAFFVVGIGAAGLLELGAESGGGPPGDAAPSPAALSGFGVAAMLLVLLFFLVVFIAGAILQFIDVAIVAGGHDATSAFAEAWSLFKTAPASVLGYSLLRGFVIVLGFVIPFVVAALLGAILGDGSTAAFGVAALVGLVTIPGSYAVAYAYHTAYYLDRRPEALRGGAVGGSSGSGQPAL